MPADAPLPFTAVILAAQRAGQVDPLAERAGVTHKCLVPILGRPLIEYVLEALAPVPGLQRIRICVEADVMDEVRAVRGASGELGVPVDFVAAEATITDSAYVSAEGVEGPLLFTTADNVNLMPDAVEQVMAPLKRGVEGTLALATRAAVLAARQEAEDAPTAVRVGPYRFADDRYSNCNLYGMIGRQVLTMGEAFREGGQFSKKRSRLLKIVGPINLFLLAFKLLTLEQAMKRLSKRAGFKVEAVVLEDGAQAVDVDNFRTYTAAEGILQRRAGAAANQPAG